MRPTQGRGTRTPEHPNTPCCARVGEEPVSFRIETYDRRYLEEMTALYNAETAFEGHIAPLHPERFLALVEGKSYFDPAGLLVAVEAGRVGGWIHACVAAGSEGGHDPANAVPRIRMLIFAP